MLHPHTLISQSIYSRSNDDGKKKRIIVSPSPLPSLFSIHLFVTCISIISYIYKRTRTVVIIKDKKKNDYPSHITHCFFFSLSLSSFLASSERFRPLVYIVYTSSLYHNATILRDEREREPRCVPNPSGEASSSSTHILHSTGCQLELSYIYIL